jgi:hypothetical protein
MASAQLAKRKRSGEPAAHVVSNAEETAAWSLPKFEPRPSIIGLSATQAVAALRKAQAKGIAVSEVDLYSGWFNLGICSLFFMTLRICMGNFQKYGNLVDFSVMASLIGTIEQWPACRAVAAMLATVSLSLVVEQRLRHRFPSTKRYFVHLLLSLLQLLQTCAIVVYTIDNIAVGICVTFMAVAMSAKIVSFGDVCCMRHEPERVPSVASFLYFLAAPTLIYCDNYPRSPVIKWRLVMYLLLQLLLAVVVEFVVAMQFAVPSLWSAEVRQSSYHPQQQLTRARRKRGRVATTSPSSKASSSCLRQSFSCGSLASMPSFTSASTCCPSSSASATGIFTRRGGTAAAWETFGSAALPPPALLRAHTRFAHFVPSQAVEPSRSQLLRAACAAARQGPRHQPHGSDARHIRRLSRATRSCAVCAIQSVQAVGVLGHDRPGAHHHRHARVPPPPSSRQHHVLGLLRHRPERHRAHV